MKPYPTKESSLMMLDSEIPLIPFKKSMKSKAVTKNKIEKGKALMKITLKTIPINTSSRVKKVKKAKKVKKVKVTSKFRSVELLIAQSSIAIRHSRKTIKLIYSMKS